MSAENPFVGAYWTAREENRAECADRVVTFLRSVADEPLLSHWCLTGRTRRSAKKPFVVSREGVEHHLRQNHTDIPRRPIPELGFSLSIWNCDDEASAGLMLTCGCYSQKAGNAVVLSLPRQVPPTGAALTWFRGLVEKMAAAFDPDVAVATSSELNAHGTRSVRENEAWIRYERGRGVIAS